MSEAVAAAAMTSRAGRVVGSRSLRGARLAARLETLMIVGGLLANALLLSHPAYLDAAIRFQGLRYLMETGDLPAIKYSMVGPIFSSPFYLLGDVVKDASWWCQRYNTFVLGAGMLAIYLLLKDRVDRGMLRKFFLLLVFASMFANHLRFYYGEVFTAVLVAVGAVAIVVGPRVQGWAAIVIGVVNTPASLAALATLSVTHVARSRRLRYLLVPLAGLALILTMNWAQRGGLFKAGYENDHGARTIMPWSGQGGLSYPIFFGVISLLFSFGKGLLFFAPGLFLPLRRKDGANDSLLSIHRLWLSFVVGLLLLYGMYWSWHGGWFWGPRYLLFAAIPASLVLAIRISQPDASLTANLLTTLALALSIWVGINGAVFGDRALEPACLGNHARYEVPLCYHTPEFSVLWYPFVHWTRRSTEHTIYLAYGLAVGAYLLVPMLTKTGRQLAAAVRDAGLLKPNLRF